MDEVRVRFAPSPTGYLHVGGARTALFNWLFARHRGGRFILRIEDTDRERSTGEFEEGLIEDLKWLHIDWDEGPEKDGDYGPYRQSARLEIYREYAGRLVDRGFAYPCFCSEEELERKREKMRKEGVPPRYDGTCRNLSPEEIEAKRSAGIPESIHFLVDTGRERAIDDIIKGEVVFPPGMVGDFVIMRSNGLPTYNFAVSIDDALMKITHVIRGDEHLSNTLRQVMIYEALEMETPRFAHIPLILGPDRSKLSKRHGAPNVRDYRKQGYPANAVVNYLSMLGWSSPSGSEIMEIEQIVSEFTLDRVSGSPSIFDRTKMNWVSSRHITGGGVERYFEQARKYFPDSFGNRYTEDELRMIFRLVSESISKFSDIEEEAAVFSPGKISFSPEALEALSGKEDLIDALIVNLESFSGWERDDIRAAIREAGKKSGAGGRDLYVPLRAAITGRMEGPDLASIIRIKGREDIIEGLKQARERIKAG
ncbi:MAG: glutamate--tRNA ligase [Candidatus Krumholzibacteriales bacterium]